MEDEATRMIYQMKDRAERAVDARTLPLDVDVRPLLERVSDLRSQQREDRSLQDLKFLIQKRLRKLDGRYSHKDEQKTSNLSPATIVLSSWPPSRGIHSMIFVNRFHITNPLETDLSGHPSVHDCFLYETGISKNDNRFRFC
jgi:hypothetical protein